MMRKVELHTNARTDSSNKSANEKSDGSERTSGTRGIEYDFNRKAKLNIAIFVIPAEPPRHGHEDKIAWRTDFPTDVLPSSYIINMTSNDSVSASVSEQTLPKPKRHRDVNCREGIEKLQTRTIMSMAKTISDLAAQITDLEERLSEKDRAFSMIERMLSELQQKVRKGYTSSDSDSGFHIDLDLDQHTTLRAEQENHIPSNSVSNDPERRPEKDERLDLVLGEPKKKWPCPVSGCPKTFTRSDRLRHHLRKSDRDDHRPYRQTLEEKKCVICNRDFGNLTSHYFYKHPELYEERHRIVAALLEDSEHDRYSGEPDPSNPIVSSFGGDHDDNPFNLYGFEGRNPLSLFGDMLPSVEQ
ncbi:MAG: hypothetical protein M1840_000560 [Geoglossum simile]|nr:MAG: hypothetical protein M1840_000560 [Geoglossum simile]